MTSARGRHRQSRHGNIELSVFYSIYQPLHGRLLGEPITQVQFICDTTPEIDADTVPVAVRSPHREGWRFLCPPFEMRDVRSWPKADIPIAAMNVRY
jgi:hypothetical protein